MSYQETTLEIETSGISLTNPSKSYLKEIASWSTFFAILGFVLCALIVLGSFFMFFAFSSMGDAMQEGLIDDNPFSPLVASGAAAGGAVVFFYLLIALLYFFPSLYLLKSSQKLKSGLALNNDLEIENGFKNLKSVFKFWGIFTSIILVIYAIIFVAGILIGMMN